MKITKIIPIAATIWLLFVAGCKETPKSAKEVEPVESVSKNYGEIGLNYANSTQKELGKNLMAAIQKEGTLGALEFCNVQAYPLTDSMATVHNARIQRVSDKPRNVENQANERELAHIEFFKDKIASGEEFKPIVENEHGTISFYTPIITNAMCLQCHGIPEKQIQPTTMHKLQELYPADKAVGYGENEVRGIWAIVFDERTK